MRLARCRLRELQKTMQYIRIAALTDAGAKLQGSGIHVRIASDAKPVVGMGAASMIRILFIDWNIAEVSNLPGQGPRVSARAALPPTHLTADAVRTQRPSGSPLGKNA